MGLKLAVAVVVAGLAGGPARAQDTPPRPEVGDPNVAGTPPTGPVEPVQSQRPEAGRRPKGPTRFEPTEKISADSAVSFPVDI